MRFSVVGTMVLLLVIQLSFRGSRADGGYIVQELHAADWIGDVGVRPIGQSMLGDRTLPLADLFNRGCGLLVFFWSSCPACEQQAPLWSGKQFLVLPDGELPIAWIGVASDPGAEDFLQRNDLAPGFVVDQLQTFGRLGVRGTPTVYLVQGGKYIREMPRLPVEIVRDTARCHAES